MSKKIVKHMLTFIVSFAILMSSLFTGISVLAADTAVFQQGFETLSIATNNSFGISVGYSNVHEGARSLHVKSGAATNIIFNYTNVLADTDPTFTFSVESGVKYICTAWVRFVTVDATKSIRVYSDYNGKTVSTTYTDVTAATDTWQKVELAFTGRTGGLASFTVNTSAAPSECYVDDITVVKSPDKQGESFESFSASGTSYGINTDMAYVKDGVKSLHILSTTANNSVLNYNGVTNDTDANLTFNVKSGVKYKCTFWVKFTAVNAAKCILVYADYKNQRSTTNKTVYATTNDWQRIDIYFNGYSTGKTSVTVNTGTAPAECYVDGITVTENKFLSQNFETFTPPSASLTSFDLNTDPAYIHDGAKSLIVKSTAGINQILDVSTISDVDNFLTFTVTSGKQYMFTAWVKFAAVDETKSIRLYADYVNRTVDSASYKDAFATTTDWQRIDIMFTGKANGLATFTINTAASPAQCYVDDVKATAVSEILQAKGSAIRTTGTQALRYKTAINKDVVDNGFAGYRVIEFGSVAIKTDYLGANELVIGGAYTQSDGVTVKNAAIGTAYRENSINIIFAETTDDYIFTAALFNIVQSNYLAKYTIRPYMIIQKGTAAPITVYGTAVSASVFKISELAYAAEDGQGGFAESSNTRAYLYQNILHPTDGSMYPNT